MNRGVRVRPEAERDVESAFAWYEEQRADLLTYHRESGFAKRLLSASERPAGVRSLGGSTGSPLAAPIRKRAAAISRSRAEFRSWSLQGFL